MPDKIKYYKINNPDYEYVRKSENKCGTSYKYIIKHKVCNKEIEIVNETLNKHFKTDFKNYQCPHCKAKAKTKINNPEYEYVRKSENKCGKIYKLIIKHTICNKEIEITNDTFIKHFKTDFKNYRCPHCNDKTKINNPEYEYVRKSENRCGKSYNHIIKHKVCNKEIEISNSQLHRHFKTDFKKCRCPYCNDKTKINNPEYEYVRKSENRCSNAFNVIIKHNVCNKEIEIINVTFLNHFYSDFKYYKCPHCITFSVYSRRGFKNKVKSHYKCLSYEYTGRNNLEYFKFIDINTGETMVLNNYQLNERIEKENGK